MTNNTFIIVLDSSKILSFDQLSKGKGYQFQNCKENTNLKDSIQDLEFEHFYKTKSGSQGLFCVIKISQNKFLELEKVVSNLDGAIESIEWPNQNEIVTFDPINTSFDEIPQAIFVTPRISSSTLNIFFVALSGLILHDIWSGLILLIVGIITKHKEEFERQRVIYASIFTILIGVLCNSLMGNIATTKFGMLTSQYYSWISNLQLIEIFSKNNFLPFNQILEYFNLQLIYLYFSFIMVLGVLLQLIKYVNEIILNWKVSRLQHSILRFFWICTIIGISTASYFYYYRDFRSNLIWIPSVLFGMLTFYYQPSNKPKNFLFGSFGVLEIVKLFLKVLPFTMLAILGISNYWITKEVNLTFSNYLSDGWDFSKIVLSAIVVQTSLSLVYCVITIGLVKLTLKAIK